MDFLYPLIQRLQIFTTECLLRTHFLPHLTSLTVFPMHQPSLAQSLVCFLGVTLGKKFMGIFSQLCAVTFFGYKLAQREDIITGNVMYFSENKNIWYEEKCSFSSPFVCICCLLKRNETAELLQRNTIFS